MAPATLLDLLETRAGTLGERALYTFLEDGGDDAVLSYAGLELRARRIGAALQALARAGERVVLLYPPGLEYVAGFFGCLYAGMVAVPAYPPDPMRLERTLPRLRAIIRDARASVVLTTSFIQELGEGLFEGAPELASLRWVATDALPEGTESGWRRPEPAPSWDTLAFLQYTSGSTGDPKGVQLSHGNLLHNLGLISHAFQVRDDSVGVIWLPPYHDMGLIGGILQPLYAGFPVALMSPLAFLRRPRFWLEALSRFGGTISGGPCFAFDLCVRKVPPAEREGLDLRRWELAFCGAEPIRPEVMTRFVEAFAPNGFQPGALYPCYGLAEGTLIASGGRKGEGVLTRTWDAAALERNEAVEAADGPGSRPLVGCGGTLPEQTLLVVDPETRRTCPPERVGEIWVSGPSVAHGYWERPELSEEAFGATLADDAGGRRFLRTGDLGLLRDGELFVVGRRKDLIILRGRNLHPQDLELTMERSHPALRPGCGAAFSLEVQGEERLAVMYEVDTRKPWTPEELVAAVRRGLSETHEVQLHTLVLIEPGALPKTSSGKIQRRACRAELLAGTARAVMTWSETDAGGADAEPVDSAAPAAQPVTVEELEAWLLARIAARLRVAPQTLARDVPLTSFGLDSLGAVELANDVESLGIVLRMEALLQGPTVAELARTLFAARGTAAPPGLVRGEDDRPAPLTSAQQRLWLFEQLHRGSPAYHLPAAVRLTGALDEEALARAFAAIARRHAVLRATFHEEDGTPSQVSRPGLAPSLRRVDLRGTPAPEREAEALRLAREEARAPFDLAKGPLLRLTLLRLDAREHLLVVVMHHIVSDGGSFALLARELSAAFASGGDAALPPLPFQYPDFARWRRELEAGSESLEWWKQRLAGAPAALELPTDHARPPVPSYGGARLPFHVPEALTARLESLGRGEGATLFMTLLAAFQVLLSRHSGQDDLCIGTPVNGRDRAGLEGLIGCFLDLLVLRGSLAGAPRFRELLARTRDVTLDAFAHRGVPFERLVDAVQPARDHSRAPLFQVLFVLQPEPGASLALPGLEARRVDVDPGATPYDLTLSLARGADGLEGWLEYATDLFDADTASRLAQRLLVLLDAVVENPDARTSTLPLLPESERHQVLVEWNATRTGFEDACLHTLIEARAARSPDVVAVVCGDVELTWSALDRRANAVARRLCEQGVGPECIVGLCADRSVDLVVGLLGILKAGGAYLPLDPSYPEARLALMLEDAAAPVVLAHRHLASAFQSGGHAVVLLDPEGGPGEAGAPPACGVRPGNLAYVLYTSGSTGRPKGVLIPHRNVANFFTGMDARVGATPGTWLAVTSVSFDISVLELLWTLSRGFKVIVQGEQGALGAVRQRGERDFRLQGRDGGTVPEQLRRHGVTHLQVTPSLAQALLLEPDAPGALAGLERMLVGGEALPVELAARLRDTVGGALLNMYGPTETTIWSSTHRVGVEPGPIPIGTPIANTALYVLDAELRPAPIGVPGELFIGGVGVARGYHARPELTAERFLPDPFGEAGARMYRTGDRARWRADGTVEFLGRVDHQLKVRGFRVEPGEIEAVLARHTGVRQAVVVAREDAPGSARLVAYVVPRPEATLSEDALRAFARRSLPEHLVPSNVVVLEALPLTPNGKVDRKALPAPEGARAAAREYVAPRTETERRIAELWSSLLGVPQVGAEDDFFALGGHSLLATRAASRLREAFGVELPVRELFEAATPAALGARIDALPRMTSRVPPLVPRSREGALPLSFAQQRLWFLEQLEPGGAAYNEAVVVRVEGSLDVGVLERCLREVIRRHAILRAVFRDEDGTPVQRLSPDVRLTLARVDLTPLPGPARAAEVERRVGEESLRPFDLASGPPLRARLFTLDAREHVLHLVLHHLVSDGWSMGVLVREVGALYRAFSAGRESPLPEPAVQYVDFASWQREWLRGEALESQLAYWRARLDGAPRALELPTDHPRPAVRSSRGTSRSLLLGAELSRQVKALAQREGATPFMVMLAGFSALLSRHGGQDDLCIGTPTAGRDRTEVEGLIGCFVNTLVLRVSLAGEPTFRELVGRARETVLGAFAHQDAPFEELVKVLAPERDLGRGPLFQAMLVLQEDPLPELSLPGLRLRVQEQESRTAKFDLRLMLTDTPEGFSAALELSTDLFEPETASRLLGHLRMLLEGAVREPEQRVRDLALMTPEEQHRLLVEWNDTRRPRSHGDTLHGLIEDQVDRTPDAVAVGFEGSALTYRELDRRANQLAWHLRARGVGPDRLVALCAERSLEMVVGLLAILKAGGAYVPLDPEYPRERLEYMLADAAAPVLLTQARLVSGLPRGEAAVVCLDSDWEAVAREREDRPPVTVDGTGLAYVIYTSGSTGRPKGAMSSHAGLVNRLLWMQEAYGLDATDRVLQKTPFSFDVSVWELFWPLLTGARLVMAKPSGHREPAYLTGVISRERITTLHFVPSMLRPFLEEPGLAGSCASVRRVFCSGEALPADLRDRFFTRLGAELHNLYGPTEAAVDVTAWACVREDRRPLVPIGRPIANARIYVLDARLRPVPVGVAGELYLGGVPLARGYWRRPELTAERFIPDAFSAVPGGRLYRTGDQARFLADGTIEYLGRLDDQVKVRGFRIELGEVEAALSKHPGVRAVAVTVREDVPGDRRLVAYVVGAEASPSELRSFLSEHLPEHMVPSAFVALEALPLSPSGKLDRRALPAPERGAARGGGDFVAPRGDVEPRLARIWAGVLGVERVGANDRFFELGGDSILALQVIARARQAGLHFTARQLFQHPTVAGLAQVVVRGRRAEEQGPVVGPVPLTPIQRWFLERELPEAHHFNQALLLELREPVDAALLSRALKELVDHHDALRLRLTRGADGWRQSCAEPGREVPLRRVDLSALPDSELERIATEAQAGLDLGEGLLLRAVLFDRGPGKTGRLLLVIHHLAVDGVSWRVLLEDLETALRQLGRGEPVVLPAKTSSFQTWARRLEAHAASRAVADELPYWRDEAADVAALPRDVLGGVNTQGTERTVTVALEPEVSRALLRGGGVEDVLLAGVSDALARWTGQRRLRIDVESHGREELFEDVDLSRTVGWFTALYPVRLELPDTVEPMAVLKSVRSARERRAGRGLGYGLLRYPRREDAAVRASSSEVLFNYLGQLDAGAREASLFTLAPESPGPSRGARGLRSHALEVVARGAGGRLELTWHYSEALHARETVEALARSCADALAKLADSAEERHPLSSLQHGLLFQVLLEPGTEAYFEQLSWTLAGPLDVSALRGAWAAVVERHAALRTSFRWEGLESPLQVVRSHVALPWQELDWRGVPPEQQRASLDAWLREDRAKGFDLTRAPLMRLAVIRLEEGAWRFVWSFHHLLLDGWSLARVLSEVLDAYAVLARGGSWRPRAVVDFRAYLEWLKHRGPEQDEAFWREQLAGIDAPTPLPAEGGTSEARESGECEVALTEADTTALQDFARRHGLTPSTLAHGAWALLLSRYGGGRDVVFGTTLAGRPAEVPGIDEAVGLFIHSLPVHARVDPGAKLLPWLRELHGTLMELGQRDHVPLTQLQGWSDVPRGTPLFESLLVFENYPVDAALARGAAGLELRDVQIFERTHYPLTAVALPGRELRLKLQYRADRIHGESASKLLEHWRTLLRGMVAEPEQRLADVSLLSEAERRRVLVEWNATGTAYPRERTVPSLFEEQAARTPGAVAVIYGDTVLTYAELEQRANRLAHRLGTLGVGRGATVGLCVERSADLVVGMLAILKAGGAYVPLDPAYPRERLAWMLADAGAPVLLTHERLRDALPAEGLRVLALDEAGALDGMPAAAPRSGVSAEDAAYVIYTSGSTGTPKGVCVPHRAVVRLVVETDFIQWRPDDRVAQASNASFDAATFEIWGALLNGARVVGVDRETALAPSAFARWLREEGIRVLFLTTAWFNQVAAEVPDAFSGLRQLHFGGEAVDPRPVRAVLREGPPERLLHVYGPTESTTFSTWHLVTGVPEGVTTLPIGRPLANTEQYVLDEAMAPVPPGGVGELWLGGDGLAWGYLTRPELTAERFVPHPFSTAPGARLYRTGDRVRLLPDGEVSFVGRVDTQVKVRGFRVEPGEVETALLRHPAVRQAAVLAREDAVGGSRRLVAYVVPSGDNAPSSPELRAFLGEHLPAYMVPSAFLVLERLPLTPNGKVDRRALPEPSRYESTEEPSARSTAPRGPEEELLAGLFSELLGVSRVGAYDSFFDLGGHSLLATRVVARIQATFGATLSLRELFEEPTVGRLAERIRAARQSSDSARLPPIVPVPRDRALPLSAMQERLWLLEQLQPGTALYNVHWAAWMEGPLNVPAFEQALATLFQRHEALRTTFTSNAGEPAQVIHAQVHVSLPVVDLRTVAGSEHEALRAASEEARRPFNLAEGPLLRALLLRTGETKHLLVLTLHHIISDGWSLGVVVRELSALYGAALHGRESPLPEPVLQPADHAVWQREWLSGAALEAQLRYWRQQLAGAPPVLELPTDFPRPSLQRFRGDTVRVHLPAALSESLKALCRREGVTPFMGLLAAFQLLLSRVSGQEDVCVGSPIAGRHHPGLEDLIGFFVNTLVLRTRLDGNPTFRELLQRVRATTLDAYSHQDVPFEKLVEALQPPRSLSHAPLVQVVLALNEGAPPDLAPEGLSLRHLDLDTGTAKFDLTLSLFESTEGLTGTLEYDADLFTPATATRLMTQLRVLLEGAVADPGQRVGDLPMMDAAERQRLLVDWNDTAAGYPREACLAELFEAQAARTPEAIAAECEDARLTYAELDRRANQLAWYLRKQGVGPGTPVGLCVQRSLELVVGMLGILKAGGAYVPLDSTYPRERLAFMVEDTRLPVVLAQRSVLEVLPSGGATVVLLDEAWSDIAREPESSPGVKVPAESLAYVMYTSGSTGRPKGVCIPQRAVARLVLGSRFARWGADEVFLQLAPICFDAATFELWGALLHGAKLVLFPPTTPTVDSLKDVLVRHGVTTLWLTAALFEAISAARPDALDGVKQLLAGGDVLPPAVVRQRLSRGGVLVNGYGPTEGTTFSVCHVMEGAIADGPVPIGRPIANTRVYVVDAGLRPVPAGVPGELLIGGDGLGWGYLGRPELTAERFIPNPFGPEAGGRLYRTGDHVRFREDGTLEFLGRLDAQVKVRGYRVEPGEVEEALRKHPAVAEAVVVAKPDPAGGKRLVAYAVPRAGEALEPRALRTFLAGSLPEFMVPSALVPLAALPLTPVGKLDRAALPEPDVARPAGSTFAEPTTALERQVAELWAKVLGVERVGVEDHFFADLGGSSMSVVKACALLRDTLKRDVPATRFFEHPTVRAFAMSLERDGEPAVEQQDNEAHVDRAQQRRQALRRQGRRGNHGNG